MELKLWAPFSDFEKEFRVTLPRIFGDFEFDFRPSIDVVKGGSELMVTAELAGVDPKEVEVTLDGNYLVIKGEKTEEKEVTEDDRYIHERSYGKFQRRIPMPEGVSADKIVATSDNGVLTIRVMLPEEAELEPQTIPVKTT